MALEIVDTEKPVASEISFKVTFILCFLRWAIFAQK
jgi:hypothetical protein